MFIEKPPILICFHSRHYKKSKRKYPSIYLTFQRGFLHFCKSETFPKIRSTRYWEELRNDKMVWQPC
ncbi:hypothetical protein RUMHYD_03507 [Blautia hydrogenotrophica DSM 10507]|uniref:Uncharacterized protein n=1 Tax=Blautia hydrogenotrophica (strain DSM 10507 / JCM 14656 / S5a33) TaxID=476272 RepID=C0CRJ2_BLAHS|nr:hypothetical protein RUMHYD_03507 [Blautia hydrogenotrophica DSM 10507]